MFLLQMSTVLREPQESIWHDPSAERNSMLKWRHTALRKHCLGVFGGGGGGLQNVLWWLHIITNDIT